MISLAGIAIFVFGNKLVDGKAVEANGVIREFEIAVQKGVITIPVGATGYAAKTIYETVIGTPEMHYKGIEWVKQLITELSDPETPHAELAQKLLQLVKKLNK